MSTILKSKKVLIAAALAVLIVIVAVVTITASGNKVDPSEQLSLGEKFLAELNYDEAILAFTKAIEIDPMNVRAYIGRGTAYATRETNKDELAMAEQDFLKATELDSKNADGWLGLVDVYIRMGEFDKALEAAKKGYEQTGDQRLLDKQKKLEAGNVSDSSGQNRKRSGYDGNGTLIWYHLFTYEGGRRTGVTSFDAAGNQTGHVDINYDDEGRELVNYSYIKNGTISKVELSYNEQGQLSKEIRYDELGNVNTTESLEYDEKGNNIKTYIHTADGILLQTYILEYDEQGRLIKWTDYNADGSMLSYYTNTWDANGNNQRQDSYDADGTLRRYYVTEYDTEGKWIKTTDYNADGTVERVTLNN